MVVFHCFLFFIFAVFNCAVVKGTPAETLADLCAKKGILGLTPVEYSKELAVYVDAYFMYRETNSEDLWDAVPQTRKNGNWRLFYSGIIRKKSPEKKLKQIFLQKGKTEKGEEKGINSKFTYGEINSTEDFENGWEKIGKLTDYAVRNFFDDVIAPDPTQIENLQLSKISVHWKPLEGHFPGKHGNDPEFFIVIAAK